MVTVDMVWSEVEYPEDKMDFHKVFSDAESALSYLVGFINVVPMTIFELEMER
jgi:hypothetical protein